ncbi:MAG: YggS family pyridoxal phosphate-dependent enzyme [Myxococcota bacterium]
MSSQADLDREVAERHAALRERIAAAAHRAGRRPEDVALVGACKRQPVERIVAAVRAGVRELGENYVQETRDVRPRVEARLDPGLPRPRWSLLGVLQRNKARAALELFELFEALDREKLARELDRRAAQAGRGPESPLPLLVQVNLSREPQKGGVAEEGLAPLLEACAGLAAVRVIGLMTVPAPTPDPEGARPAFARLRELRDRCRALPGGAHLGELSMGMSADFEVAVEEGATRVRIGTALFGARREPA